MEMKTSMSRTNDGREFCILGKNGYKKSMEWEKE